MFYHNYLLYGVLCHCRSVITVTKTEPLWAVVNEAVLLTTTSLVHDMLSAFFNKIEKFSVQLTTWQLMERSKI